MSTEQILERLMREYGDSVFRMCFLYLKDYHLAEDATQGTFMKAMKKLKDYFEYSYAAEPPVQFRLSHLSRRSEPL